jgi:O-antigen/teichoic acid export membrane protein
MPALTLRIKKLITGKGEYAVLYRSAAYSMGIKAFAVAAAFAMNFIFARFLGAEGVGQFFLVFSVVSILSMAGKLGMDRTALRFISAYAAQDQWGKVKGVQFFAFRLVGFFTICTSVGLFFLAPYIATYWFKQPALTSLFQWFALGIAPLAIIQNTSESLKGLGKVQLAQVLYDALLPTLATLVFITWYNKTSLHAVFSYLAAAGIVFFVTQTAWWLSISKHKESRENLDKKELLQSAIPIFWTNIFQQVILWMPAFMLGLWASTKDVGIFQVAFRVAQLIAIFQTVFNSNLAPRISALYVTGQIEKIQQMCAKTTRFVGMLALPLFIAFTLFSNFFTGLFGPDFKSGGILLTIMAIGQFYNILMGPVGISLIMCGREKKMRNSMIISSCSLLLLNCIFIPWLGALGAALTSCIVLIIQNTLAAWYLWKELGIITFPYLSKRFKK